MMNKIHIYVFMLLLVSCQADFNPLSDSSVRDVSFYVDPGEAFSQTLLYDNGDFHLCNVDTFPDNSLFRLSVYCYDEQNKLCRSLVTIQDSIQATEISIARLDTNRVYSILFIGDFVQRDTLQGLNSSWFYLNKSNRDDFNMSRYTMDNELLSGVVLSARWQGNPTCCTEGVVLSPIVYNGYFRFINFVNIDQVDIHITYSHSAYLWAEKSRSDIEYDKGIVYVPSKETVDKIIPIQYFRGNNIFGVSMHTQYVTSRDTLVQGKYFNKLRPFVWTIDCGNLMTESINFY